MSHLVLDASMALSWLLPDEASEASVAVQSELVKAEGIWVAAHWRLEVANSLCMAERRKRLDASGIAQAVALFTQLPVIVDPETERTRQCGDARFGASAFALGLRRRLLGIGASPGRRTGLARPSVASRGQKTRRAPAATKTRWRMKVFGGDSSAPPPPK